MMPKVCIIVFIVTNSTLIFFDSIKAIDTLAVRWLRWPSRDPFCTSLEINGGLLQDAFVFCKEMVRGLNADIEAGRKT